jgi:hypothetical protein
MVGSPPLRFAWKKNQSAMSATNSSLFFPAVTTNDSANYLLTVTNDLGVLNATFPLHVVIAPYCTIIRSTTGATLSWPTIAGQRYTVEEASSLQGPWFPWTNSVTGDGTTNVVQLAVDGSGFYRVRVE